MHIVLIGALPDARAAQALLPQLAQAAPALMRWLAQGRACIHTVHTRQIACTAQEWWQLRTHGYQPLAQQNWAAGLGALRWQAATSNNAWIAMPTDPAQAVWLAELVHISPTQHGASLLTAEQLHISEAHDHALFASLHDLNKNGDFTLHRLTPGLWRVTVAASAFAMTSASPALVAETAVNDWWPQQAAARNWRRLFNEVQMLWFNHPVNQQRQHQGLPAVNGLWLFGGASPNQFSALTTHHHIQWMDACLAPLLHQDWVQWLQAWAHLDATLQDAWAANAITQLDLIGQSRVVTLTPGQPSASRWLTRLKHTLTGNSQPWTKWWLHQD